jgi:hypothetical protein
LADGDRVGCRGRGRRPVQNAQYAAATDGDRSGHIGGDTPARLVLRQRGKGRHGADAEDREKDGRAEGAMPELAPVHAEPAMRAPQGGQDPPAHRPRNPGRARKPLRREALPPGLFG